MQATEHSRRVLLARHRDLIMAPTTAEEAQWMRQCLVEIFHELFGCDSTGDPVYPLPQMKAIGHEILDHLRHQPSTTSFTSRSAMQTFYDDVTF